MPMVKVKSSVFNTLPILLRSIFIALPFLFSSSVASAQKGPMPRSTPPPVRPNDVIRKPDDERPLTTFEEEMRAKRAIKLAEKEHEENLERARELAQLGKELHEGLKNKASVDRTSLKKLERLEKLTKKIRGEAGGDDEEVSIIDRPSDMASALAQIAEASETLSKNVQNTPRQVVSASVISDANVLLELIRLLRLLAGLPK